MNAYYARRLFAQHIYWCLFCARYERESNKKALNLILPSRESYETGVITFTSLKKYVKYGQGGSPRMQM